MPEAPKMPSIPTPVKGDMTSLYEAVLALKQTVELMMGTRSSFPVARVFVQDTQPVAYNTGDIWVLRDSGKVSYWDGARWLLTT